MCTYKYVLCIVFYGIYLLISICSQEAELKHQKAIVERDLCLPEKSVGLLREVCETIKNIYGENHVKVALIESELSVSLRHKNDLEGSKQVALSALQKLQQGDLYHSGITHTHTYVNVHILADTVGCKRV